MAAICGLSLVSLFMQQVQHSPNTASACRCPDAWPGHKLRLLPPPPHPCSALGTLDSVSAFVNGMQVFQSCQPSCQQQGSATQMPGASTASLGRSFTGQAPGTGSSPSPPAVTGNGLEAMTASAIKDLQNAGELTATGSALTAATTAATAGATATTGGGGR